MDKKTTSEVAKEMNITKGSLLVYLQRHPKLRPAERVQVSGMNYFLWTEAEIAAVIETKANAVNGRPKGNKKKESTSK